MGIRDGDECVSTEGDKLRRENREIRGARSNTENRSLGVEQGDTPTSHRSFVDFSFTTSAQLIAVVPRDSRVLKSPDN